MQNITLVGFPKGQFWGFYFVFFRRSSSAKISYLYVKSTATGQFSSSSWLSSSLTTLMKVLELQNLLQNQLELHWTINITSISGSCNISLFFLLTHFCVWGSILIWLLRIILNTFARFLFSTSEISSSFVQYPPSPKKPVNTCVSAYLDHCNTFLTGVSYKNLQRLL